MCLALRGSVTAIRPLDGLTRRLPTNTFQYGLSSTRERSNLFSRCENVSPRSFRSLLMLSGAMLSIVWMSRWPRNWMSVLFALLVTSLRRYWRPTPVRHAFQVRRNVPTFPSTVRTFSPSRLRNSLMLIAAIPSIVRKSRPPQPATDVLLPSGGDFSWASLESTNVGSAPRYFFESVANPSAISGLQSLRYTRRMCLSPFGLNLA